MTDIIVIIISVAVGVVVGNLVQGVVNTCKFDHLMRYMCDRCGSREECNGCGDCECCSCSGEDDE